MARTPRPWFWEKRDAWFCQIEGKHVLLARGRRNHGEAQKRLRELLVARDKVKANPGIRPLPSGPGLLLGDLALAFANDLTSRQERGEVAGSALADFTRRVRGFVEVSGDVLVSELRPHHVTEWLKTRPKLGATSRADAIGAVKAITAWALRQGLIDRDPLAGMKKPTRQKRRESVILASKIPDVISAIPEGPFRDLVQFLFWTGCRPSEATTLRAKDLDLSRRVAVLADHKTRLKTGRARVIPLPDPAVDLVRRLAERHPEGPIFRNAFGNSWTKDAINCAVIRTRKRANVGNEFTVYALRHAYATDGLAKGLPVALVAEALGHASPRMLSEVYSSLVTRTDLLAEIANKVRGDSGSTS